MVVPVPPKITPKTGWVFNSPLMLVTTPVDKEEIVVEPLGLTVKRLAPLEEATVKTFCVGKVDVPWTNKVEELVVVPIATEPLVLTVNSATPVEVLIWKGMFVPVPCTKKLTVEDVALTPATVPLS